MAGSGDAPSSIYIVETESMFPDLVAHDRTMEAFQNLDDVYTHHRISHFLQNGPVPLTAEQAEIRIQQSKGIVESRNFDWFQLQFPIMLKIRKIKVHESKSGGRRSGRTLRRHNTLHRNVRRHNVK